jgi:hypothetical protein
MGTFYFAEDGRVFVCLGVTRTKNVRFLAAIEKKPKLFKGPNDLVGICSEDPFTYSTGKRPSQVRASK